jgi:hypothetical protein
VIARPAHEPPGGGHPDRELGSVLYDVLPDHAWGLAVLVVVPVLAAVVWQMRPDERCRCAGCVPGSG